MKHFTIIFTIFIYAMASVHPTPNIDTSLSDNVNLTHDKAFVTPWLTFRNRLVQNAYEKYRERDVSPVTSSIYIAIYTLAYIYGGFVVLRYFTEHPTFYFPMFFVGVRIILLIPAWMMFLSLPFFSTLQRYSMFRNATVWGNIFIIANSVLGAVFMYI